jgi:hypothetical protein
MKRFVLALALTCALSGTVLAGYIPTIGIAPPTPTEPQTASITATVILTILSLVR